MKQFYEQRRFGWWTVLLTYPWADATWYPSFRWWVSQWNWEPLGLLTQWWGQTLESSCPPCVLKDAQSSFSRSSQMGAYKANLSPEMAFLIPKIERSPSFLVSLLVFQQVFPLLWGRQSLQFPLKTSGNLVVHGKIVSHTEVTINPHPFSSSSTSQSPQFRSTWSEIWELQIILSRHFPASLTLDSLCQLRKQRVFQMILFSPCNWGSLFNARKK